jgi:DUF4097 and DUF4098 domain-containing protein YvlB
MLMCIACASSVAAQAPNTSERAAQELRQQARRAEAQAQRGAARGRSDRGGTAEANESFSQTVRLVSGGTFELQNQAGDVSITGGGGRDARIEATKRVRGASDARVRAILDTIRIDVAERGGNVEVRTLRQRGPGNATVDYTITLPENVNVILRSASGNLNVLRMAGDELRVNTLSGNVFVRELKGRMVDVHTVSGNMLLQNIDAQRALLDSMAGNLEYAGRLLRTGRYQFHTHQGDIRVTPSGNPGFDLEAMTFKGDLRSDFVLTLLKRPRPVERLRAKKMLRGTVGDAGAVVTASSFSGNIWVIKP